MISKVVIFCAALAVVHCTNLLHAPVLAAPIVSTGISSSSRQQDAIGNYAFNYGIADGLGATNGRTEVGDAHGNKVGSYSLTDIDGRARRVDYVADSLGFRASVKTNEPGTALSAPAAAAVISPYAAPVAPVAAAPVAAVAPAPLAFAPAGVTSYSSVVGHAAPIAPYAAIPAAVTSYNTVVGHAAPIASYSNLIGSAAFPASYGLGLSKSIFY